MATMLVAARHRVLIGVAFFFAFSSVFPLEVARALPPPRVVVGSFSGPQSGGLRVALKENLEGDQKVTVIPEKQVDAAKKKSGIKGRIKKSEYPKLAQAAGANIFVSGAVRKKRRGWSLVVTVRDAEGEVLGRKTWSGRTLGSLRGIRRNGAKRLEPVFAKRGAAEDTASPSKSPDTTKGAASGGSKVRLTPSPGPKKEPGGRSPVSDTPSAGSEAGAAPPPKNGTQRPAAAKSQSSTWYGGAPGENKEAQNTEQTPSGKGLDKLEAVTVALTAGVLSRNFGTRVGVYERYRNATSAINDPTIIREERSYRRQGLGHVELGFQGEVFPGLFMDDPALTWLGATFNFRNSVGLSTSSTPCAQEGCPDEDLVGIGTVQREFGLGLRGRHRFGDKQRDPRLFADIGWGQFSFLFNSDDLQQVDRSTVIPPMQYNYLNFGVGGSYGLIPTYLTVRADFAFRLGLPHLADTRRIWGLQTKPSQGFSLGAEIRSEAPYIVEGFFFSLDFQFFQFATNFAGQTRCIRENTSECAEESNAPAPWEPWPYVGDIDNQDIAEGGGVLGKVRDNYIRLGLKLGYSYR